MNIFLKLLHVALLMLACILVCFGYLALLGPIAPNVYVWWPGIIGPFVVASVAFLLVWALSANSRRWITTAANIYAIGVSVFGMLIAGILYAGRNDSGQNHSDYALFFVALWAIASPLAAIFVGAALWERIRRK